MMDSPPSTRNGCAVVAGDAAPSGAAPQDEVSNTFAASKDEAELVERLYDAPGLPA
jgi:hypothetical protein